VSAVPRNAFAKIFAVSAGCLAGGAIGVFGVIAAYVLPYRQYLDAGMLKVNTEARYTGSWLRQLVGRRPAGIFSRCSRRCCW
jgi:hypothetical protein